MMYSCSKYVTLLTHLIFTTNPWSGCRDVQVISSVNQTTPNLKATILEFSQIL